MFIKKSRLVILIIVVVVLASMLTTALMNPFGPGNFDKFIKLLSVTKVLDDMYYQDFDVEKAANEGIAGIVNSVGDPYTVYLYGDDAKSYMEDLAGDYCGVGLYISADIEENIVYVMSPIAGSAAEKAGIKAGDKILAVDNVYYTGEQLTEIADAMRGEEGTEVTVKIRRASDGQEKDIVLTRAMIDINSISGRILDGETGYIRIERFTEGTADNFYDKYNELLREGMKSVILDLRSNPGGVFGEVVDVAGCFIEKDKVVTYTEDKSGKRTDYLSNGNINQPNEVEDVIVLVNNGSASASEILTGALKDYGIARIVGEKTFGKGIVQSLLAVGDDLLSVTTSRYFTPNGICIHGEGIEPDVIVEMPIDKVPVAGNINPAEDEQLLMALDMLRK